VDNTRRVLLARAADLFASKLVRALQAKHPDTVTPDRIGDALRLIESATVSDAIVKVELEGAPCLH
jgi:ActR/RegA family two-component response regulator